MERFDVDMCLRELEEQDEREKEALRKFLERERETSFRPDWWKVAAFVSYTIFWAVVAFLIVAGLMAL
jgi:hypothetical protein